MRFRPRMDELAYIESKEKVYDFVMKMNSLTQEEFSKKYLNDVNFHNGVKTLIHVFVAAEI